MQYFVARPLVANVPEPKEGYLLDHCPICGTEVWSRPVERELLHQGDTGFKPIEFIFVCTVCALKSGKPINL